MFTHAPADCRQACRPAVCPRRRRHSLLPRWVIIEWVRRARKFPRGDEGAVSADHPAFLVVTPSLPGYVWSEGVQEKGFHAEYYMSR